MFGHLFQPVLCCDGWSRIRYHRHALGRNGGLNDRPEATAADDFTVVSCRWDFARPLFFGDDPI